MVQYQWEHPPWHVSVQTPWLCRLVDEREYDAFLVPAGLAQYTDNVLQIKGLESRVEIVHQRTK